jgi:tRNA A37 methylthiotransferase MiaB
VRQGTTAAKIPNHVAAPVIRDRAALLRRLCRQKHATFVAGFDGARAEVLVEKVRDPRSGLLRGYTRNYTRAMVDGPNELRGRRVPVRLHVVPGRPVMATVAS